MKESLEQYIERYQEEEKRFDEQFFNGEALHKRLVSFLSAEKQQEIRRLLQLNGLKDLKNLIEDVKNLNKSIYEGLYDEYDFQYNDVDIQQEEFYERYNEYSNLINTFKELRLSENISEIIIKIMNIRHLLLMKTSEALFVTTEEGEEVASREEKASDVYQRKPALSRAREEAHQELALKEHEASAVEKNFAAFLKTARKSWHGKLEHG